MKIGSFDTSSITSSISNAVNKVEDKVSSAVNTVESKVESAATTVKDTVVKAEAKVENFAKSEYKEVKDFAKVTGQKLEQKFDSAVHTVKDAAKELPSFRVPQGVKDLSKKVFGDDKPKGVEGGADMGVKNGGDPNEKVDLNDKEAFLKTFGQKDRDEDTLSDGARCQSNTIIAGLLMKGGPDEVKKGLTNVRDLANDQLKTETDPARKKALETAVKNLNGAIDGIANKTATRGQLDHAADALFTVMTPAKDKDGKAQFNADGTVTDGIKGADKDEIRKMEAKVGLSQGQEATTVKEKWFAPFTDDNREVSDKVWDSIKPGESAHVAVNLYGEHVATGKDPWGQPLKYDDNKQPYFEERVPNPKYNPRNPNSEETIVVRRSINREAQHAVLMGRNADGTRYLYNPMGDPPYVSEKKGDKASVEAFDKMSTSLMGVQKGKSNTSNDWQAEVTKYGG
jgi:hypothetical protein